MLNSRLADADIVTGVVLHQDMHHLLIHLPYKTGQHKNKADFIHYPALITHLRSTHMVNAELLHVQMCIHVQNIANI